MLLYYFLSSGNDNSKIEEDAQDRKFPSSFRLKSWVVNTSREGTLPDGVISYLLWAGERNDRSLDRGARWNDAFAAPLRARVGGGAAPACRSGVCAAAWDSLLCNAGAAAGTLPSLFCQSHAPRTQWRKALSSARVDRWLVLWIGLLLTECVFQCITFWTGLPVYLILNWSPSSFNVEWVLQFIQCRKIALKGEEESGVKLFML